jgi:4-oxalocrotonate tautomerase
MSVLNYREESVSLSIKEIFPADRADKVNRPDIVASSATLYKKPGYKM